MRIRPALTCLLVVATITCLSTVPATGAPTKKKPPAPTCLGKKATKVLKKSNQTLRGTSKNDVLVATGKGDTVLGLGGNDRICVAKPKKVDGGPGNDQIQVAQGSVLGGAGDDVITQKGSGKLTVDAGPGKDKVTVTSGIAAGSSLTGGADPDVFTVPAAQLANVSIPVTSGDRLNGINLGVDQPPNGGPTFTLLLDGQIAGATPTETRTYPKTYGLFATSGTTDVGFAALAYAPGRDPASWSLSWGDGTATASGIGAPPRLSHGYLADGTYTITAVVTDNRGVATTRTGQVHATTDIGYLDPTITAGAPAGNSVTFTLHAPPLAGTYPITSWVVDFGDQTEKTGTGSPDGQMLTHLYPQAGHYEAVFETLDAGANRRYPTQVNVALGATRTLSGELSNGYRIGIAARTVAPDQSLRFDSWSQGYDSYTLDPGDGQNPFDQLAYFSYGKPGTYTLKYIGHRTAQPDEVLSIPITVVPLPTTVRINAPSFATEGPVTMGFAGSVIDAGARWNYNDPRTNASVKGTGPLPTSLTEVLTARAGEYGMTQYPPYQLNVNVKREDVPLTDVTSLDYNVYQYASTNVVPLGSRADALQVGNDGYNTGELLGGVRSYSLTMHTTQPLGVQQTSQSFTVDGVTHTYTGSSASDLSGEQRLLTVGDHLLVATATDSAGGTVRRVGFASIAAQPKATAPATMNVTHNVAASFTGYTYAIGANAKAFTWTIAWNDNTPPTRGYGTIPASVSHTFPAGGPYNVVLSIGDDHGQTAETNTTVTVT